MNDLKIESTRTGFQVFQNSKAAMVIDINGTPIAHRNGVWTQHNVNRDDALTEETTEPEDIIGSPPVQILVNVDIADMMRASVGSSAAVIAVLDKIVTLIQVAKDTP